jgi:hypothetical protein
MMPSMITESVDDVEQAEEMSRDYESVDSNPVRLAITGVRNADPAVQSNVMRKKEWRRLINQAEHVRLHAALMEHHYSLFVIAEHKMDYHSSLSSSLFSSSCRDDAFSSSSISFRCYSSLRLSLRETLCPLEVTSTVSSSLLLFFVGGV